MGFITLTQGGDRVGDRITLVPVITGVFTGGGVGGGSTPPPHDRTDENFQHRIQHGLFSSLCYICSIVGTVAFNKYY
jgi:hypothetical protein